jgi:hypothetical protein
MQTETDLVRTQQMQFKDEFLSHVSHELRSPLSAIRQFVTILLDRLAGELNPEQQKYLEIVLRNAKQLQSMINDLFEVTGVQAGKLRIEVQRTSVSDAIVYVVDTLQEAATAKGITLSSTFEGPLPTICADPMRLRQILIILLDNAIKFTPANGAVKIEARRLGEDPNVLILEVSDSGCGISPDMTEQVFERLVQAPGSSVAGRKGLGLGLYICKELVTRQAGKIWAKSVPGQGSVFSVTFPIFSLPSLIAPAFRKESYTEGPVTLVVTEMSSSRGWLSEEARAEHSRAIRHVLEGCMHSGLDVLLPKMGFVGTVELFFIVAMTDATGGEAITKRIREQMAGCEHVQHNGLSLSSFYRSLPAITRNASKPIKDLRENVASTIQELMNEEISSRMVKTNGQ